MTLNPHSPAFRSMSSRVDELTRTMTEVTAGAFFATVGQLNVHPSPVGFFDETARDYLSEWRMCDGTRRLVGASFGGRYWRA
jgi:hypothetical protein